jgi:hypothetical protein
VRRFSAAVFAAFLLSAWLLVVPSWALEPVAKPAYRITGVAVSSRGSTPIPYCRMRISESNNVALPALQAARRPNGDFDPRQRRQEPAEVDADVHGRFEIALDHPGAYILTGTARGYRTQFFDAHEGFFSSIVLTPAAPFANVTFRMERDASITGLVLDEAGEPVRNAQVVAETPGQQEQRPGRFSRGAGADGRQAGFAQTDDRGRYELTSLAPGPYRVRVTAQPWYAQGVRFTRPASAEPSPDPSLDLVYPPVWFPGVEDDAAAELIQLTGGEERQADFHLTPVPSVHVIVPLPEAPPATDGQARPQRGAFLVRVSPAGGGFNQSSTGDGLKQDFGGLSPGLYEIHTTGPDGRPDPEARQLRVLPGSSGVVDLSSATMLTKVTLVTEGVGPSDTGPITFVDAATGRSVNPDGGFFGGFGGRRRETDQKVEHAVYLSPGKWEVQTPAFGSTYLLGLEAKDAEVVGSTLTVSDHPATLTLHLGSGRGEVAGVATGAGKPVEGAMVLLVPATLGQPGSVAEVQRDQTNTDGSFLLRGVVPGKYILLAIDHGWGIKWHDLGTLAAYLPRGLPVEVASKEKVQRNVQVTEP